MTSGALGGIRGLAPVSQMLSFVGVNVIANQVHAHFLRCCNLLRYWMFRLVSVDHTRLLMKKET